MNRDDKIREIKYWLITKGGYYVDIPEESIDNIYNLVINNICIEPEKDVEYLYYGLYYRFLNNEEKMMKYTLASIEFGNTNAMANLATMYKRKKDHPNMIRYYLMAIKKSSAIAMNNFADYYRDQKDYDNMIKYYLMAIKNGCIESAINLANYYEEKEDYFNTIKFYIIALKMGNYNHINNIRSLIRNDRLEICCYIEMIEQLDYELYKKVVGNNTGLILLYKTYRSKIDMIELPFKYSPDNEGFIQAKGDFVLNLQKDII